MRRPRHRRRTLPEIAVRQRFHTVRGYSQEVSRARLRLLDDVEVRRLRAEEFTYSEVGETTGVTPTGYRHVRLRTQLGSGRDHFDVAREAMLSWQIQLRANIAVAASHPTITDDAVAILGLRIGRVNAVRAPVAIVAVESDEDMAGFTYGTLPGHPEMGEERFELRLMSDESVQLSINAFSRPATLMTRLGRPVAAALQDAITRRYGRALQA